MEVWYSFVKFSWTSSTLRSLVSTEPQLKLLPIYAGVEETQHNCHVTWHGSQTGIRSHTFSLQSHSCWKFCDLSESRRSEQFWFSPSGWLPCGGQQWWNWWWSHSSPSHTWSSRIITAEAGSWCCQETRRMVFWESRFAVNWLLLNCKYIIRFNPIDLSLPTYIGWTSSTLRALVSTEQQLQICSQSSWKGGPADNFTSGNIMSFSGKKNG
jgi:hypothetical protein